MIFMHGLCHDEVRILIFDDPGEQERSQVPKFVPLKSTLSKSKSLAFPRRGKVRPYRRRARADILEDILGYFVQVVYFQNIKQSSLWS